MLHTYLVAKHAHLPLLYTVIVIVSAMVGRKIESCIEIKIGVRGSLSRLNDVGVIEIHHVTCVCHDLEGPHFEYRKCTKKNCLAGTFSSKHEMDMS